MNTILVATGISDVNKVIQEFEDYQVMDVIDSRKELIEKVDFYLPQILLIGENLSGEKNLIETILQIAKEYPEVRIVYLAGELDMSDKSRKIALGTLVLAGVHDIYHESKINVQMLKHLLDNPKPKEAVNYLVKELRQNVEKKSSSSRQVILEMEDDDGEGDIVNNLFMFSSIKPGSGKSFLACNCAVAVGKYGKKIDGRPPNVALIEADLQNLSVGTLLQVEHDKWNLLTALENVRKVLDDERQEINKGIAEVERAQEEIGKCFLSYFKVKNVYALTGSNLPVEKVEKSSPAEYMFILDSILSQYDVVIIDTNSSLYHNTAPLMQMAKNIFYVLDMDYNNVRNNKRYQETLQELNVLEKSRYILNQAIDTSSVVFGSNKIKSMFDIAGTVPVIDKSLFFNSIYEGIPVVLRSEKEAADAKQAILKIANQIWPIEGISNKEVKGNKDMDLDSELTEKAQQNTKKGFLSFRRDKE